MSSASICDTERKKRSRIRCPSVNRNWSHACAMMPRIMYVQIRNGMSIEQLSNSAHVRIHLIALYTPISVCKVQRDRSINVVGVSPQELQFSRTDWEIIWYPVYFLWNINSAWETLLDQRLEWKKKRRNKESASLESGEGGREAETWLLSKSHLNKHSYPCQQCSDLLVYEER